LLTILSALSLLVFLAAVVLWVRSYFVGDVIGFENSAHPPEVNEWFVRSNYGSLYLARNEFQPSPSRRHLYPLVWISHAPNRGLCGPVSRPAYFILGPFSIGRTEGHSAFTLPHWSLAALTAIAPLIWFNRFNRWRRTRRRVLNRLCIRCGYDLRATPGRCPECGHVGPAVVQPLGNVKR
jgi:hypothetical protein